MANFGELINAVADDLNRDDLTAQCSDAVVMAIRHYAHKRWWFNEASNTFTTTASTSAYVLPSDFRAMDYVEARWPGDNWQEVRSMEFATVKQMNEGTTVTGYPSNYSIRDQKIHLAYTPNGAYTVRLYYQRALAALTASASSSWTTDCQDLVRAHAARTVALRTLHDPELASLFSAIEQTEYQRLMAENDKRVTSGKVPPW